MPRATQTQGPARQELPYPESIVALYRRLRRLPYPMLLTSGRDNGEEGLYDIIVAAPDKVLKTYPDGTTHVKGPEGELTVCRDNPFDVLKRHFGEPRASEPEGSPFAGGAVGYLGYELQHPFHCITPAQVNDIAVPVMVMGIYHWSLIIDHAARRAFLVTQPDCPDSVRETVLALIHGKEDAGLHPGPDFHLLERFRSNFSRREYGQVFQQVIDYIHAGDCYQVNLAQRFTARCEGDPLAAFERLHARANAPFSAYMEFPEGAVLSFSPERFIQVRQKRVMTQPIKGTRPRHPNPEEDARLLAELTSSDKDRAENLMIVDLLRNDLGRVCRTGSVKVPSLFAAHSFQNVHHLISTIEGLLEQPGHVFDLLKACFPGGSITGTPKLRAMEIINELETRPRSVYCGSILYIGFDGGMDSNICIRTLVCAGDSIHCWGGGGVVADSDGGQEYQETLDKISIFINNLENP